jgi:hypothetical protein
MHAATQLASALDILGTAGDPTPPGVYSRTLWCPRGRGFRLACHPSQSGSRSRQAMLALQRKKAPVQGMVVLFLSYLR